MGYKLVISEYADELLNNLIYYLIYRLKNEQAMVLIVFMIGWKQILSNFRLAEITI